MYPFLGVYGAARSGGHVAEAVQPRVGSGVAPPAQVSGGFGGSVDGAGPVGVGHHGPARRCPGWRVAWKPRVTTEVGSNR